MKEERRTRRRGVRLKAKALVDLQSALHARWRQEGVRGKLTREMRAELMGVSVVTADRILHGRGTDRPTLTLAFKKLGIPWDDALCEELPAPEEDFPADSALPSLERVPDSNLGQSKRRRRGRLVLVGTLALVTSIIWGQLLILDSTKLPPWRVEFDRKLAEGSTNYHNGRFGLARIQIDRAIELAQKNDAARTLASAMRMSGDIEAAQGKLQEALGQYEAVFRLRSTFLDARSEPALLEAMGTLETRLGNLESARRYLNQAMVLYQKFGDTVGVAMAVRDLGTVEFNEENYPRALALFSRGKAMITGLGKSDLETDIEAREALVLREMGKIEASRLTLQKCLAYWQTRAHQRWIATSQFQLATVEVLAGNDTLANDLLQESIRGFEEVGDVAGVEECQVWVDRIAFEGHPASRSTMRAEADISD